MTPATTEEPRVMSISAVILQCPHESALFSRGSPAIIMFARRPRGDTEKISVTVLSTVRKMQWYGSGMGQTATSALRDTVLEYSTGSGTVCLSVAVRQCFFNLEFIHQSKINCDYCSI